MKESFSSIADTRQQSQVRHDLYEIIAMTIAGVIGNCDGWDEIEDFCYSKENWLREHMKLELEHGRIEKRTYYLSSDLSGLENVADWAGLAGFGMVHSHVTVGEVESFEIRYAITSLKSVEVFAHAWRKHWGIENGFHYCLDVSFNEDHSRIRKDHAPDNMAVIRHFALSALKQLPEPKRASIKRKRKLCAYDLDYLSSAVDLILL